ncbi:hypothetical protein [Gryllotalpicola koreensis]|uniref:Uncharacterized protein n=1 Tax=Gryllotalpicola koreensis TaxID=993086 RepID=A0ABP8A1X3_9MICO
MPINPPPEMEAAIAAAIGVGPYDAGSMTINLVNLSAAGADTTVRFTTVHQIPTQQLLEIYEQTVLGDGS